MATIRKGDIIVFKLEWRDPGDEKFTHVARNDECDGRFDCSALELSHWPIWPMQIVRADMVEAVTGHLNEDGTISAKEESL